MSSARTNWKYLIVEDRLSASMSQQYCLVQCEASHQMMQSEMQIFAIMLQIIPISSDHKTNVNQL